MTHPRAMSDIHDIDCPCPPCRDARGDADRALTPNAIAAWSLAGVAVGNVLAFLYDPDAAVVALRATVGL